MDTLATKEQGSTVAVHDAEKPGTEKKQEYTIRGQPVGSIAKMRLIDDGEPHLRCKADPYEVTYTRLGTHAIKWDESKQEEWSAWYFKGVMWVSMPKLLPGGDFDIRWSSEEKRFSMMFLPYAPTKEEITKFSKLGVDIDGEGYINLRDFKKGLELREKGVFERPEGQKLEWGEVQKETGIKIWENIKEILNVESDSHKLMDHPQVKEFLVEIYGKQWLETE